MLLNVTASDLAGNQVYWVQFGFRLYLLNWGNTISVLHRSSI